MKRVASRRIASFLFALAWTILGVASARAAAVAADEATAVRAVVEAQLAAFAADDAERAFSYAAPSIRELFQTPDRFMAMVRSGYPAVYRPASVVFLHPVRVAGQLFLGVQLADADGSLWLATYRFERQPDKNWRISGCELQPSPGRLS